MVNKKCIKCGFNKKLSEYPKSNRSKDGLRARCRICIGIDNRNLDDRNKLKVIRYYSNGTFKCACCNEHRIEFLTVDHIHGNGNEERKKDPQQYQIYRWVLKNKFPDGFRILCINCNFSFGIWGYCPHTTQSRFTNDMILTLDKAKRCQGVEHRSAKLTEQDVRAIRTLYAQNVSVAKLMVKFGVNESSIRKIINFKTWKHIQ